MPSVAITGPGKCSEKHFGVQGGWETDETLEQAAHRETVEEAGVRGRLLVRSYARRCFSPLELSLYWVFIAHGHYMWSVLCMTGTYNWQVFIQE